MLNTSEVSSEVIKYKEMALFAAVLSLISAIIFVIIAYQDLLTPVDIIEPVFPQNTNIIV